MMTDCEPRLSERVEESFTTDTKEKLHLACASSWYDRRSSSCFSRLIYHFSRSHRCHFREIFLFACIYAFRFNCLKLCDSLRQTKVNNHEDLCLNALETFGERRAPSRKKVSDVTREIQFLAWNFSKSFFERNSNWKWKRTSSMIESTKMFRRQEVKSLVPFWVFNSYKKLKWNKPRRR